MTNSLELEDKLYPAQKFFLVFLSLISFDGILRLVFHWSGLSILNFYKEILFVIWLCAIALKLLFENSFVTIPRGSRYIFGFCILVLASIVVGFTYQRLESPLIPLWGLKTSFFYFPILFVLFSSSRQALRFFEQLVNWFSILIIPIVLYGLLQFIFGSALFRALGYPNEYQIISLQYEEFWSDVRPVGTFRSANDYGMFCLFFVVFFFFRLEESPSRLVKRGLLFAILGVLTSLSKNSLVGLVALFVYAYAVRRGSFQFASRIKFIFPLVVFAFVTLVIFMITPIRVASISEIEFEFGEVSSSPTGTMAVRLLRWASNIGDFLQFGLVEKLFGSGYGNYGTGRAIGALLNIDSIRMDYHTIVDNNYLLFLLNVGLVGSVVAYLLVRHIVALFVRTLSRKQTWLVKAAFVFFLIVLTNAFFINVLESFPGQILIYLTLTVPFAFSKPGLFFIRFAQLSDPRT